MRPTDFFLAVDGFRWESVWPGTTWKSNVPWTREILRRPGRRRSRWRSTGRVSTSSWRSTTCWTWQWFVLSWHIGGDHHIFLQMCQCQLVGVVVIESAFGGFFSIPQITGELSPVQEPSSLRPSPGHRPVPAKHLVSTETSRKPKKNKIHQGQPPEAGAVPPKCSSQLDTRCTSAAVPKIDVSAAVTEGGEKVCGHDVHQ